MAIRRPRGWMIAMLLALMLNACSESQQGDSNQTTSNQTNSNSTDAKQGFVIFSSHCAACHGSSGQGSEQGPPLMHNIYRASHHSDYSIERAIKLGTRSHHWQFGDMAPVAGLNGQDIKHVIAYIRQAQRKAGIQ